MVQGRTRTGRALRFVPGINRYTQYQDMTDGRWDYIGCVFDGFEARPVTVGRPGKVVVTVGTSTEFGFRTLIERLVDIIPPNVDVVWQTGSTDVTGLDIDASPWIPAANLEQQIAASDVVVAHAGCGSALTALTQGKRPILVARQADRGEFNDNHQQEIAARLADRGLAVRAEIATLTWEHLIDAAQWTVERHQAGHRLRL